jgi:adenylyltransferase/sulfurtransferase
MKSISVSELRQQLTAGADIQLIDVREPFEHEAYHIGGLLIPMSTIFEHIPLFLSEKTTVLYCQKGIRSQLVIQRIEEKYGPTDLINLTGGMDAWMKTASE